MSKMTIAGLDVHGHFVVVANDVALVSGFFSRSKTKVRGVAANFGKRTGRFQYRSFQTDSDTGWKGIFSPVNMGRERFTYCLCVNEDIGKKYLVTTEKTSDVDWFEYLMANYKLPLLKEWIPVLKRILLDDTYYVRKCPVSPRSNRAENVMVRLNNHEYGIKELLCYDFSGLSEKQFEEVVSSALATKQICIVEDYIPPLSFDGMDEYFSKYGHKVVDNLDKTLKPLVELKPNVTNLALKSKSLFPQQAASVEGVLAMERAGIHYAVLNHGMGVGKTIESASIIESCMVGKWLKQHPGKTLRDAYERDGVINYRAIIMPPGHLVSKWAQEVEEEIPYAKATILNDLSQLIEIKKAGKMAFGKEYYILSKDFCKLDSQQSPIPTQIKKKYIALDICKECFEEEEKIVYKRGVGKDACCPDCNGKSFMPYPLRYFGSRRGLMCPKCGELLIGCKKYNPDSEDFEDTMKSSVLTPDAFAKYKNENAICYHCGTALWGTNAKPLVLGDSSIKEPKWYKVSHFSNHAHKGKTTSYVLKGHEKEYYATCITTEGLTNVASVYGARKVAPAKYIKKYLKGFFDFCVLDEAHKYLGESAQATAAHALVKSSKFTLALTGTISNGTATSFYNLFWMLEPSRLKQMGYSYGSGDLMRFCKEYGCVETVYEATNGNSSRVRNSTSRGKQLTPPRVKPGISPVLLGRLLIDRCLFLDISDLSKYLPKLKERVVLVTPPDELLGSYNAVINTLKEESQKRCGMAALSTMLQFGLSYMDKPYGRRPIMDPYMKDSLICNVPNYDEYASLDLLTSKEEKLIELIKEEIDADRGVFVYATFTGTEESNVTYRLKELIEKYCNLEGRVDIIQSTTPAASKREEYFHKRASEGIKVFITNPQNVETGLDFCFKHNGRTYNYPTLIFYQTSYSLATIWQASRRAYRLNQKEECKVYYLAYEKTLQAAAIEIMAKKQIATAAIQGHFSAEGLSAMAKGVDARAQLAAALSQGDMSSRESLENMFDALESMNENVEEDEAYRSFVPSLTFYELIQKEREQVEEVGTFESLFTQKAAEPVSKTIDDFFNVSKPLSFQDDFQNFFSGFGLKIEKTQKTDGGGTPSKPTPSKTSRKRNVSAGQFSIFELA